MKDSTAERLHGKLRRYSRELGHGWLDAMQVIEEAAHEVGGNGRFKDNLPAFAQFLEATVPSSVEALWGRGSMEDFLERLRRARNSAVHRGTAGHRLEQDVKTALRLTEEALVMAAGTKEIGFYMVFGFLEAGRDETLASVRDSMLRYDYSALPVRSEDGKTWLWVRAQDLAAARCSKDGVGLSEPVSKLCLPIACVFQRTTPCTKAVKLFDKDSPALLVSEEKDGPPIGILTPFDLLYANP